MPNYRRLSSGDLAAIVDSGDTAWLLVSSALVMLMAPGLALSYGDVIGKKKTENKQS